MRFVDVKNDVAFRKIFGNEKKTVILISFLNAVLNLKGQDRIKKIKFKNPYQFLRIAGEKATIIDVSCTDESGRNFIVEMQVADVQGFDKRVQYYVSRDYSMQIKSGEEYAKLNPTVFVGILDFNYFKTKAYLSNHLILDEKTFEHKLKHMRFCFIELPKFNKKERQLKNNTDKWIYFIKNAKNLEVIPENVTDEGLLEAYKDAERHSWTANDLREYDNASIRMGDEGRRLERAVEKAMENVAKQMRTKGYSVKEIADITGLTAKEIEEL
jgi:predicted transposase/invertase (TIGR01784 family)